MRRSRWEGCTFYALPKNQGEEGTYLAELRIWAIWDLQVKSKENLGGGALELDLLFERKG